MKVLIILAVVALSTAVPTYRIRRSPDAQYQSPLYQTTSVQSNSQRSSSYQTNSQESTSLQTAIIQPYQSQSQYNVQPSYYEPQVYSLQASAYSYPVGQQGVQRTPIQAYTPQRYTPVQSYTPDQNFPAQSYTPVQSYTPDRSYTQAQSYSPAQSYYPAQSYTPGQTARSYNVAPVNKQGKTQDNTWNNLWY